MLSLENVYKKYASSEDYAVRGITFECKDCEFIAILGPSGCGKTTTLRMIAGLESVTKGTIRIDNRVVNDVAPRERGIGLAFEDYALYPPLRVFDNIAFNLRAKKIPTANIKKQVLDIADLLHVTDILEKFPRALSGGQKQRVNIARALVRQPKILLLDEPMSHLDGKLRQLLRREIRKLHKKIGCTTILVTHDQLEAMSLADRLVIMDGGHVQQCAIPSEVYRHPHNEFVAEFIGDPPMNIVDATVKKQGQQLYFSFYDIDVPVPRALASRVQENTHVRFGIRPDDVIISDNGTEVSISVFENLGEEKRISILLKEDLYFMISTTKNVKYSMHEKIKISFKDDKIHIFNS